ncbi:hypothetical protein HQ487_00450 [Candidatus Uhrbacteria bacterium]|nr:hypothetical protein [Candidatus Uhrbacteria bacterium]
MNEGGLLLEEEKEFKRMYRLSLWWVEHRDSLRRIGYALFIAFDAVLLLFAGWHLLNAFAIKYGAEERIVMQMVAFGQEDLRGYTVANAADDLEQNDVRVISIGSSRYDLYTELLNPNADWWAEFDYTFTLSEGESQTQKGFILPGQEKPLSELAIESSVPISSAKLVLENIQWHRVDHHLISNYETWSLDRLNLVIEDALFEKETRFDGEVYGRTTFTVANDTAFSYYDVGLYVLLMRGSSVVGVNRTTLSQIVTGEEVEVTVNWFGTLPSATQVVVIPELNIFDVGVYKPLVGETTRDTRTRAFR